MSAWPGYYDRAGRPIDNETFYRLKFDNPEYGRVAESLVDCGNNETAWISTVWLGLDHRLMGDGPPLIFETLIFGPDPWDGEMARYSTEAQALAGHDQVTAWLREQVAKTKDAPRRADRRGASEEGQS